MKQALVVGLGMFGMSLARELTQRRHEVILVDRNPDLVQVASEFAVEALALDATDEESVAELRPALRDLCICAIGEDSRDASIVCTALLRQLGARHLVARAFDPIHERILRLVGAHEVVNPERAFGQRLAARLAYRGVLDQAPLGHDLEISEVITPRALVGKTLRELELPRRYGVFVVALRSTEDSDEELAVPAPDTMLESRTVLILAAKKGSLLAMMEKLG